MEPVGPELHDLVVQVHADPPAHADHHRLAVHRRQALFEVLDQVAGDEGEALLGAHDGLDLRPLALELLLALDLLALGHLLELGVDLRALGLLQLELGEPALVVDRDRGLVLDSALDVVDADVVAEDRARVGVGLLDRRAREADERGVRQRVAHVAREAVDEVVLAAVRFVRDDHDVAPLGEHRVPVALGLGQEFLDRGEHDPARLHRELLPEVRPALGLDRRLAQEIPAAREGAEELVVEVVAVGQDDDRRVRHRGLADDPSRVEGHGEALARPLRVPDDADAPVPRLAAGFFPRLVAAFSLGGTTRREPCGAQRLGDGHPHRVKLVIARRLLRQGPAPIVLEDDEVAEEIEQPALLENALEHDLQLRQMGIGELLARDRAPGLEPLPPGGERADARLEPVRDHEQRAEREQRRQLGLVGLELLEGGPDGGVLVRGVLQLDEDERQTVDEEHHVRTPRVLGLADRELVDREPVVVLGVVEVDHLCLSAGNRAVGAAVLDGHPVHEQAMEGTVARLKRRSLRPRELAEGVVERLGRQRGVDPSQRLAQAFGEHDLPIIAPFRRQLAGRDVRAVLDGPTEVFDPGEGGVLDGGLGEPATRHEVSHRRRNWRAGSAISANRNFCLRLIARLGGG